MNNKQEIIIGYLDPIGKEEEIWNTDEEFPSFCGGSPVFLLPIDPKQPDLQCEYCQKPLKFLLQLYAPLEKEHAFYRALYVFYCDTLKCTTIPSRIKVFRQQTNVLEIKALKLGDYNELRFSSQLPMLITPEVIPLSETLQQLRLAKQLLPQKRSNKKPQQQKQNQFSNDDEEEDWEETSEMEVISEEDTSSSGEDEKNVVQKNSESKIYDKYLNESKTKSKVEQAMEFSELEDFGKQANDQIDGTFLVYQQQEKKMIYFFSFLTEYKNHILRYCFNSNSEPLWFSDHHQFNKEAIPKCRLCNSQKQFECQINNSLLSYFKELYTIEWGAFYIYSCPNSCQTKELTEETLFIQFDDHEDNFQSFKIEEAQLKQQLNSIEEKQKPDKKRKRHKKQKQQQNLVKVEKVEESKQVQDDDW